MSDAADIPFGPWLLGDLLGVGGFAEVRKARRRSGGEVVALKRLLPMLAARAPALRAFSAERAALSRLQSPAIVGLIDSGTERDLPWLALELVEGGSLTQLLRAGPLALPAAAAVVYDVALALAACHAADVLHGDIAPGNVLVDAGGAARLIDFGLATSPGGPPRSPGAGTPAFVDPQVARGEVRGAASDLFSLSLLWVRLRAGQSPLGPGPRVEQRRRAAAGELDLALVTAALADAPPVFCAQIRQILAAASPSSARQLAASLAPAVGRGALSRRVAALPPRPRAALVAAEDRREIVTDPSGETVTAVGKSRGSDDYT